MLRNYTLTSYSLKISYWKFMKVIFVPCWDPRAAYFNIVLKKQDIKIYYDVELRTQHTNIMVVLLTIMLSSF